MDFTLHYFKAQLLFHEFSNTTQGVHDDESACAQVLSHVQVFVIPWTVAHQSPLSIGFSRQEYWSGLPFPSPGDLPDPGTEPKSAVSTALAGGFFTTAPPVQDDESIHS